MGRYLEEFTEGEEFLTPGRTITESDVIAFASLSGDQNEIHTNLDYVRSRGRDGLVPQVLLVMALASGLMARLGLFEGTAVALRDVEWTIIRNIDVGDTINCRVKTLAVDFETATTGIITRGVEIVNQRDEIVQSGQHRIEVARRPIA